MIIYVKRSNIDIDKYNNCIANSSQCRVYAYSWYLDVVADNWGALILGDYQAVMPLPWKKKYMLKYVSQPYFCQQLGVFSLNKLTEEMMSLIAKSIPKSFVKINLQFNSFSNINSLKLIPKENYILNLNKEYNLLKKQFSKGRKHAIKVSEKLELRITEIHIKEIFEVTKKYYSKELFIEKQFQILSDLYLNFSNKIKVLGVFNAHGELLGGAFFLLDDFRITYLYSSFTDKGKKAQASSALINFVIQSYANQNLILDFEGSIIYGIASFYRSFGAKKEDYYAYKRKGLFFGI